MTVLYLTEPGTTLAARSRTLVVRHGTVTRARVPVLGLDRVAVLAPAHLTSAALALCAREQVELVVMARGGRGMARLGASEVGLELRGAQHRWAEDPAFGLEWARAVVRGKVRNLRRLLSRAAGGREPPVAEARTAMERVLAQVETAATVPVLRGVEGHASAHYFRALRALLNPEYASAPGAGARLATRWRTQFRSMCSAARPKARFSGSAAHRPSRTRSTWSRSGPREEVPELLKQGELFQWS